MKNPTPDFPPFTRRQLDLLEEIKAAKEELRTLPSSDPKRRLKIQRKIDDLSVKALRSGMLKGRPAESRRPGFCLVFDSHGKYAEVLPGFGDFHPDLPPWAKHHFIEWIRMLRLQRHDARDILRKTKIVGIETGVRSPEDVTLFLRFLELREFKEEEDLIVSALADASPLDPSVKVQKDTRLIPTNELSEVKEKERKRTRKERRSLKWVIKKLVEEGLLPKEITPQALKKRLKTHYPEWPWEKV
jgi:hypothetical protein